MLALRYVAYGGAGVSGIRKAHGVDLYDCGHPLTKEEET
jgi:hypothetical protein